MSAWSRIVNVFCGEAVNRDLDEEMRLHVEEAVAVGRDPAEAARAFGSALRTREESRDVKVAAWLESLRADTVFGWRQLRKNWRTSTAAILSLGLAIGSCTAAFRLIDAFLLRPLPVADPANLFVLNYEYEDASGKIDTSDGFDYPGFRRLRAAVPGEAELMAISYSETAGLTLSTDRGVERLHRQFVSGWMFQQFGLKPALGRLLTEDDDRTPGAHPYAVISYDLWTRRFGRDPAVLGRTFLYLNSVFEIVGVTQEGFTGTETGVFTDLFLPMMMHARTIDNPKWSWFRIWVQLRPGVDAEAVRQKLRATLRADRQDKVASFWPPGSTQRQIEQYIESALHLVPGAAGISGLQKRSRQPLIVLGVLVALVLLIACANVANLLTAQAASRAREMALRVSIGAGRGRLVQLVLIESLLLAVAASILGAGVAWRAAPFVVSMINPADNPARVAMPADWRVTAFGAALTLAVTILFGLAPALRTSAVDPVSAIKGGEVPGARRRLMGLLVAVQVALCFVLHLVTGLFVSTLENVANQPTGFVPDRLLAVETLSDGHQPEERWRQVAERLRSTPGVESAALAGWALLSGPRWATNVWANGRTPDDHLSPYFLSVSPGWLATMRIPLIDGRDFSEQDQYPRVAIVNEAFARAYFDGRSPLGQSLEFTDGDSKRWRVAIVGLARNARYLNMRQAIYPTVYVPYRSVDGRGLLGIHDWSTFMVRTGVADPQALASLLRQEVPRARSEFRVASVRTQEEIVRSHTVRERMLATLSLFFAAVALVLAGVGLYGVLDYAVLRRRREFGIRIALGAAAGHIAWRVTVEVLSMLVLGAAFGLGMGVALERYVVTLLYQVKATDPWMLALPAITILAAAVLAALPPVLRAVRIEPVAMLRSE